MRKGQHVLVGAVLLVGGPLLASHVFGQDHRLALLPGFEHAAHLDVKDRRTGLAVFPARYLELRPVEILDPSGIRLLLTSADSPGDELAFPAGELFDPPIGRFRIWLEGEWEMTPYTQVISVGRSRPPGVKSLHTLPMVPAGRIRVDKAQATASNQQLRLLYAGGDPIAGRLRAELTRRARLEQVGRGILMPEGPVIAAVWDPDLKRYVRLSRPFDVTAQRTVKVPLEPPASEQAHLVVYVGRPDDVSASWLQDIELTVKTETSEKAPDATIRTVWGVYGFWYALTPGPVSLAGGGEKLLFANRTVTLTAAQIGRVQGQFEKRMFVSAR